MSKTNIYPSDKSMDLPSFDDLKATFDKQNQIIDAIVERHDANPKSLNFAGLRVARRKKILLLAFLFLASVSFSVLWSLNLGQYNYDLAFLILSITIEFVYIILSLVFFSKLSIYFRHLYPLWFIMPFSPANTSRFSQFQIPTVRYSATIGVAATVAIAFIVNSSAYAITPDTEATQQLVYILEKI